MSKINIYAIAAIGANREIGKQNKLIWRIPADLIRLKELTVGKAIVMGRKTYESIGRPLPQRTNIVVSRQADFVAEGCITATNIEAAIAAAHAAGHQDVFIFGGAQIYAAALPLTNRLYLTKISSSDKEADSFFPEFEAEFEIEKLYPEAEHQGLTYQWIDYVRKST